MPTVGVKSQAAPPDLYYLINSGKKESQNLRIAQLGLVTSPLQQALKESPRASESGSVLLYV